ncbi:MAG: DMT family transporter [bacterium]
MPVHLPVGEVAALGTAFLWSFSSMLFASAGRRIGSLTVNRLRLLVATLLLMGLHTLFTGSPIPHGSPLAWMWLALSGIIGFAIGDTLLFRTFVILGPRIGMVLMTLTPVFSALLALILLDQRMSLLQQSGMITVIAGVSWAVIHRPPLVTSSKEGPPALGIVLGILSSLCQATGLVLSRLGMDAGPPPLTANLMRLLSALAVMTLIFVFRGRIVEVAAALKDRIALTQLTSASTFGPVVGVWLSLVAVNLAPIGIAATLMSISPVLLIPLSHFLLRERIHPQSVIGTGVAVIGVALLIGFST